MKVPSVQGRQEVLRYSVQSVLTRLPVKRKQEFILMAYNVMSRCNLESKVHV